MHTAEVGGLLPFLLSLGLWAPPRAPSGLQRPGKDGDPGRISPSHGQLGVPAECQPERGSKPRSGRLALPARTSSEEHRAPRGQRVTRRPGELVTEGDQTSCFDRWGQSEAGDRRAPS